MRLAWPQLGLPLLAKELSEQAARRRTYVVRVVYASLLFLFGFLIYQSLIGSRSANPFAVLGHGRNLFDQIVMMQFVGIYLFMPAMTCGVVTGEKERNSIGLLFLTRLGPWTILLEKYLSRVIPMLSFLLLSLPLLVIAYSLGGITQGYLWVGIWTLFVTMLQVGAIALFCSAYFRRTVSSFIATYLIGIMVMFGLVFLEEACGIRITRWVREAMQFYGWMGVTTGGFYPDSACFFGPVVFSGSQGASAVRATISGYPILFSALFFILLARRYVVRRAFLPPTHAVLAIFRWLDRFFSRLNQNRLTRGIVLIKDADPALMTEPVAWRETTKTTLGSARYLARLFLIIEFPVAVLVILLATVDSRGGISVVLFFLWILSALIMSVKGASLISGERSNETLDVLLTAGLSSAEIIKQKAAGLRKLGWVLAVPLLTCIVFRAWIGMSHEGYRMDNRMLYLVCSLLSVAVYLPLVGWLSFWIGLRVRNHTRAIFASVAAVAGWCIVPLVVLVLIFEYVNIDPGSPLSVLLILSPATVIPLNEFDSLNKIIDSERLSVVFNFLLYGWWLFAFRLLCTHNSGRDLGRLEGYE